jgi:hypothetical protein
MTLNEKYYFLLVFILIARIHTRIKTKRAIAGNPRVIQFNCLDSGTLSNTLLIIIMGTKITPVMTTAFANMEDMESSLVVVEVKSGLLMVRKLKLCQFDGGEFVDENQLNYIYIVLQNQHSLHFQKHITYKYYLEKDKKDRQSK